MAASEDRKAINNSLERIIENLTEILAFLKTDGGTRFSEMQALVFAKRRMIDLTEQAQLVYKGLVSLKYAHALENKERRERPREPGFDELFRRLR